MDLRRESIKVRKATLANIRKSRPGVRLNEILSTPGRRGVPARLHDGAKANRLERLGSHYRSGRSRNWLKAKNPEAPAVKREAVGLGKR
jgi:hypothetical protein